MPDKLILGVYRNGRARRPLVAVNRVSEHGMGGDCRLAGPSLTSGSRKPLDHTLAGEDSAKIRRLGAVFPQRDTAAAREGPLQVAKNWKPAKAQQAASGAVLDVLNRIERDAATAAGKG